MGESFYQLENHWMLSIKSQTYPWNTKLLFIQISQDVSQMNIKTWLCCMTEFSDTENRKNDLILIMTPKKQDKTLELSKHWSADSTPARNEVIMKRTYPVNR